MRPGLEEDLTYITSDKVEGWCTHEKAHAMASLILDTRPKLCVELGVFGGKSLLATAVALKENGSGVIWGIDPWVLPAALEGVNDQQNAEWWSSLDIDAIRNGALNLVSKFGVWNHVRIIAAKSEECHEMFNDIDVLHIDGNHSEEKSCLDVLLWVPRVKQGGYIWFDDIDWPSTQKALSIIKQSADVSKEVVVNGKGACALFKKR